MSRRIFMVSTMNSSPSDMFGAWWGWPPPVLDPAGPYADSVVVLAWALIGMGVVVTAIVVAALYVAIKGPGRWRLSWAVKRRSGSAASPFPALC